MLNYVIAIVIGFWFYKSAQATGAQPWKWAIIGAALFAGTGILVFNLLLGMVSPIRSEDLLATGLICMFTGFGAAFLASFLVHRAYLKKAKTEPDPD